MVEIDRYALAMAADMQRAVAADYERYQFHLVAQRLQSFCSEDLGAFYLDVLKDRLYTAGADSRARRSAQTALALIRDALLKLKRALSVVERVRRWGERAVKRALKLLGLDVDKIERWMNGILQQINPFKPLKQAFAKLVTSVQRALANLPGVDALLKVIDSFQALADRLQATLDDFLAGKCGNLFGASTAGDRS